jgi:hypothetical protein
MAHDLILGKTKLDWSCGRAMSSPPARALDDPNVSPQKLGEIVRSEIQKNYDTIVTLTTAKRLPEAERKAFGGFFRKWIAFALPKDGKFHSEDTVALINFRSANSSFVPRLKILADLARTPLTKSPGMVTPTGTSTPDPPRPWGLLSILGLGLGLFGLGFASGQSRKLNT